MARVGGRVAAGVPVAVLALVLSACGSDDGATPEPDGGGANPPSSATPPVRHSTGAPTTDMPKQTPTAGSSPSETPTEPTPSAPVTTPAEPPRPPKGTPATYDEALAHFRASTETLQLSRFSSPSTNIYCVIKNRYIPPSCELGEGGISDPDYCGDGPTSVIGRIELDDGNPTPVCNSDTIRQPGGQVLPYGAIATTPGSPVQCLSEEIGVTCLDTSSTQGFLLARGTYVLFTAG